MPCAGPSPMTCQRSAPPSSQAWSMAPSAPRMPQVIFAPSKAGPAAVEQATRRARLPSTSSPLVPMSIIRVSFSRRSQSPLSRQATVSAPTKPPITGSIISSASGFAPIPHSDARSASGWLRVGL